MGQPVKIVDLAERMIRLSGLQPGHDIDVVFTGMRPGERLNEILFASEEPTVEIGVAGIMAAKPNEPPMQTLRKWLAALEEAIARDDRSTIRAVLKDAVPEFGSNRRLIFCRLPPAVRAVSKAMMQKSGKVVVVSQHYPPDPSTTAVIMAKISERLAQKPPVLVLSGTAGSARRDQSAARNLQS